MTTKIGLELHIRLKTKSKLFSSAANDFQALPNSVTTSYDRAYPGTLPVVNELAVKLAIRAAGLFKAQVAKTLNFDRKNYYYFDLPKGYQITQFYNPIGQKGQVTITTASRKSKTINIQFIALEEDSAKTLYLPENEIWLDFNRVGSPLIEVTTAPDFADAFEVKNFLKIVFNQLKKSEISTCQFEWGTVRIDVNISVTANDNRLHPRTEVKNLNSLANIEKAIEQEVILQTTELEKKGVLSTQSWTKKFDEKKQCLLPTRIKLSTIDYFYIPEANLLPFELPLTMRNKEWRKGQKICSEQENVLKKYGLNFDDYQIIFTNDKISNLFIFFHQQKIVHQHILLFLRELIINKPELEKITEKHYAFLALFLKAFANDKINFHQVKKLFLRTLKGEQIDLEQWLSAEKEKLSQVSEQQLKDCLAQILQNDQEIESRYRARPEATMKYLMGQLMQQTQGRADPRLCQQIIRQFFSK